MLVILKNDIERILQLKIYIVLGTILIMGSVIAAIFISTKVQDQLSIAILGNKDGAIEQNLRKAKNIKLDWVEQKPQLSELVTQKYDAIVTVDAKEHVSIQTVKGKKIKQEIQAVIQNPKLADSFQTNTRKIGTNIIGFMSMFILLQGILNAKLFADDKEKHLTERIITTPISFGSYLLGHGLYIWLFMFLPSMLVIIGAKILGFSIGFSVPMYAVFIGILSFLSFAIALCINSFFQVADDANLLGSALVILSSVLAGGFGNIGNENGVIYKILHILPQKDLINFVNAFEKNTLTRNSYIELSYVIIISIILLSIGVIKTKKDYIYR